VQWPRFAEGVDDYLANPGYKIERKGKKTYYDVLVPIDPTLGDAILDRIIHRSHRIELKGESLRKRQALAVVAESLTAGKEK
jgi:hypothetical protein